MIHRMPARVVVSVVNQRESVKYTNAKISNIVPVVKLVDKAGLSFPTTDGIKAIAKNNEPDVSTQSCQTII